MATSTPPVNVPKLLLKPSFLDKKMPIKMVVAMAKMSTTTVCHPNETKSPKAMRKPSNATPYVAPYSM